MASGRARAINQSFSQPTNQSIHQPADGPHLVFRQPEGLQLLELDDGEGEVTEAVVAEVEDAQARDTAQLVGDVGQLVAAQRQHRDAAAAAQLWRF